MSAKNGFIVSLISQKENQLIKNIVFKYQKKITRSVGQIVYNKN